MMTFFGRQDQKQIISNQVLYKENNMTNIIKTIGHFKKITSVSRIITELREMRIHNVCGLQKCLKAKKI